MLMKVFQAVEMVVRMLDCWEERGCEFSRMGPLTKQTGKQIIHKLFHLCFVTSMKMNVLPRVETFW